MNDSPARLDLRLNAAEQARITRAAAIRGVPVSTFVRDTVLREADAITAVELAIGLSAEESRRFLAAVDEPLEPNARLKKAMDEAAKLVRPR